MDVRLEREVAMRLLMAVAAVILTVMSALAKADEPASRLIEPLGPVRAVHPWNQPNPVFDPTRERIMNTHDYDRVSYAYRNTYGLAAVYGYYPLYIYPCYAPRMHHRHHRHW
jgi:hypothetical protein